MHRPPPRPLGRVDVELFVRWLAEVGRFKPSTLSLDAGVSRRDYRSAVGRAYDAPSPQGELRWRPWGLTAEETEERLRHALAAAAEGDGLGQWIGSSDGEPIGLWMLQPPHGPSQPRVPGEADLGYRLPQRYWRQGYASEGARELVRHGFEELGLTRIFAQTMAVNQPSRATMASVGLKFVRTFAEDYDVPIPGQEQGEVEYDTTRERWLTEFRGRHLHDPDPMARGRPRA